MFDRGRTWLWDHDIPGKAGLMKENTSRNQAERTLQAISGVAFIAGGFSGTVMALAICPLEQVKIQMQLSRLIGNERLVKGQAPSSKGLTNMQAFREIVRLRGVYGLYSGLRLHVARDSFGTAVYFGAYDTIKETLRRANSDGKSNTLSHLLAGGTCGVLSWLVVFPIDLIKSTIQKDVLQPKEVTTSSSHCSSQRPGRVSGMGLAKSIYQRYGISGLYRGVGVTLIRAFPLHGLNFVVYEFVRQTITDFSKEDANA
ncbi:hypothetical protein H4219_002781 [Mycoemilia scoparia]|uniref:Uncharacterized protein n=1 Tax=Mycoemilia scoparia TaxID=417184 RepID=A0A9W8DUB0_9FUNG|nr:hypothetical protein H4219_002781 [Mycoemilia scoparia]